MRSSVLSLLTVFFWTVPSVYAGKLGDFIENLGAATNVNEAGAYRDQSAGHYSAGGLMIRQKNKTITPLNLRLPDYNLGGSCGDFDIRMGGISFIQGNELAEMLRQTAQGVPSYALQLALKTVSPQIEGTMSGIRSFLQKLNSSMLNDCWARQRMLEGLLPTGSAMHEKVCQDMLQADSNADYTGARKRCQRNSKERDQKISEAQQKHGDLLVGEFNLVWNVLKKMPRYKDDMETAELILSMVGTVVSRKGQKNYQMTFIDPKIDEEKFLEAHLSGGQTTGLVCGDKGRCLDVQSVKKTIDEKNALKSLVSQKVASITAKYYSETAFSLKEIAFLNDTVHLPIYKYIQVSAASHMGAGIERATEYIALAVLLKQFEEVAAEILEAISVIETIQFDTKATTKFKERLELARNRLHQKMQAVDTREIWMIEKMIKAKEQEMMSNYEDERGA